LVDLFECMMMHGLTNHKSITCPVVMVHCSNGKPEADTAVYKLLMMGKKMPEICWAVFEQRAINLTDWCNWLVDLFESNRLFWPDTECTARFRRKIPHPSSGKKFKF